MRVKIIEIIKIKEKLGKYSNLIRTNKEAMETDPKGEKNENDEKCEKKLPAN